MNCTMNEDQDDSIHCVSASRAQALEEAELVLSSSEYVKNRQRLENFNLLSVVANPHGYRNITPVENNNRGVKYSSLSKDQQEEETFLSSMTASLTKEIENINCTIQSYSRTYLGNNFLISDESDYLYDMDYYLNWDYDESENNILSTNTTSSNTAITSDLVVDFHSVEMYLNQCGPLTSKLSLSEESITHGRVSSFPPKKDRKETEGQEDNNNLKNDRFYPSLLLAIPDIFFQEDFQLSDPKTFESVLLRHYPQSPIRPNTTTTSRNEEDTRSIVLHDLDAYTQYLDTIELTLLRQVRSHAETFFQESDRFYDLKSLVEESITDVRSLQLQLSTLQQRTVVDIQSVPFMDATRYRMRILDHVLEDIDNVLDVKSCVGGLVAAGDYLGAVEAVNVAKSLLNGCSPSNMDQISEEHCHDDDDDDHNVVSMSLSNPVILKKIKALGRIFDEISRYENVVVMDLCHELVDLFLIWGQVDAYCNDGAYFANPSSDDISFKAKSLLLALQKSGKLSEVTDLYRERLCHTIRVTIRAIGQEYAKDIVKQQKMKSKGKKSTSSSFLDGIDLVADNFNTMTSEFISLMTASQYIEFMGMIFEQVLVLLESGVSVNKYCREEGISLRTDTVIDTSSSRDSESVVDTDISLTAVLCSATEVAAKSVSEILRVRKETNAPKSFDDIKRLWDLCLQFIQNIEILSSNKCYSLRSALMGIVKSFIEQKHESNLASLASTLEGENWVQCDVSTDRQTDLQRLCTGRAVLSSLKNTQATWTSSGLVPEASSHALVEGKQFRLVWSCLILVEMVIQYIDYAVQFQALATSATSKISELLRLFNTRTIKLILGAGAIHGAARLKSINAKHLALVMQSLHLILIVLPHVRAALMAQLPSKQHALLADLDVIKKDYTDHIDKVVSKFVSIIGGIVEHGLAPSLVSTNFDERSNQSEKEALAAEKCCPFLSGIASNTKKMHQVLSSLMPSEDLIDVFSRIFVYLDSKVPTILISYDSDQSNTFSLPTTDGGKYQLVEEVEILSETLNSLPGTLAWEFSAVDVLKRRLGLTTSTNSSNPQIDVVTVIADGEVGLSSSNDNYVCDSFQNQDNRAIDGDRVEQNKLSPKSRNVMNLQVDEPVDRKETGSLHHLDTEEITA